MDFGITNYSSQLPLEEFVAELMKKRTRPGYADLTEATLNQVPHLSYNWTDGIYYITSLFHRLDDNTIQEVSVSIPPHKD